MHIGGKTMNTTCDTSFAIDECQLFLNFPEIILSLDEEGRITKANYYALKAYGYSLEELTALKITDLDASGNQLKNYSQPSLETVHKRKDGTTFPVKIQYRGLACCGCNLNLYFVQDLTQLKSVEQRAEVDQQTLELLYDSLPVGIAIYDRNERMVRCNNVFKNLLGYSQQELQQMTWQDYTHPDDVLVSRKWVDYFYAGKVTKYKLEKRYISKAGEVIWASVTVGRMLSYNNNVQRLVVVENITERKEIERLLKQESEVLNVVLFGKQSVMMEGLRFILHNLRGINLIGQVITFEDCLSLLGLRKVDILLIDQETAGENYLNYCQLLSGKYPHTKIALIGTRENDAGEKEKIPYINLQDQSQEELLLQLKGLCHMGNFVEPLDWSKYESLTPREKQILFMVASGKTNKEIGQEIHLSPSTVRNYVSTILQKLNIPNRTAAAVILYHSLLNNK